MSLAKHIAHYPIDVSYGKDGIADGADVDLGNGIVLEFATVGQDGRAGWGVWGVRIDGQLYREPRDMEPEPMREGTWREMLNERAPILRADADASERQDRS